MALHSHDGAWLSLCLDLSVSAKAASLAEAQRQLSLQIRARVLRLQPSTPSGPMAAPVLPTLPLRHRFLCRLLFWLAPLRKARVYRETLPFGLAN